MGTAVRPEISEKHKYWIDRHRYYELKHFCLQYPLWKKDYQAIDGYASRAASVIEVSGDGSVGNPTCKYAESRLYLGERIQIVEVAAQEADSTLWPYILRGVTDGISYEGLRAKHGLPCCKETYYDIYRRFFWLLSKARN